MCFFIADHLIICFSRSTIFSFSVTRGYLRNAAWKCLWIPRRWTRTWGSHHWIWIFFNLFSIFKIEGSKDGWNSCWPSPFTFQTWEEILREVERHGWFTHTEWVGMAPVGLMFICHLAWQTFHKIKLCSALLVLTPNFSAWNLDICTQDIFKVAQKHPVFLLSPAIPSTN